MRVLKCFECCSYDGNLMKSFRTIGKSQHFFFVPMGFVIWIEMNLLYIILDRFWYRDDKHIPTLGGWAGAKMIPLLWLICLKHPFHLFSFRNSNKPDQDHPKPKPEFPETSCCCSFSFGEQRRTKPNLHLLNPNPAFPNSVKIRPESQLDPADLEASTPSEASLPEDGRKNRRFNKRKRNKKQEERMKMHVDFSPRKDAEGDVFFACFLFFVCVYLVIVIRKQKQI